MKAADVTQETLEYHAENVEKVRVTELFELWGFELSSFIVFSNYDGKKESTQSVTKNKYLHIIQYIKLRTLQGAFIKYVRSKGEGGGGVTKSEHHM